jgi:hypothetical protein
VQTVSLTIDVDAAGDVSEHPAPKLLFAAVAALCLLCDAHDTDHMRGGILSKKSLVTRV